MLRWPELPPDVLRRIGDTLDLDCYSTARGVCTAWRCALAPPCPSLLLHDDHATCAAASLLTPRSFLLNPVPGRTRCVGSTNGWLALSFRGANHQTTFSLFNPITAAEIILPPFVYGNNTTPPSKIVFAPGAAKYHFAAAAICDFDRLAYVTAGATRWAIPRPVRLVAGDRLADLVYHEKNRVFCVTLYGDVHVLRLRRRELVMINDDPSSVPAPTRRSFGPYLNAPASLKPLRAGPFDAATNFAPPYTKVSVFTGAKNLVFCDGNLYQIWRNTSCAVTLHLSGDGHRRVTEDEVFVLKYYPPVRPCWDVVTDLGGYSVFLGTNNAVAMYAEAVPGLKGNCIYWIGGRGGDQGMVFDLATGMSTTCRPAAAGSPICWYFLSDMVNNHKKVNNGCRRVKVDGKKQQDMKESPNCLATK